MLMSVYNGERYLREAIESILSQTFTDFEFIIIDDGSTDGTSAILDQVGDPRIVRSRNEANIGLVRSLNNGLKLARGEYVARMDADDVSLPRRLQAQVDFMDRHPEVGVLGCAIQHIDACGRPLGVARLPTMHGVLLWWLCFGSKIAHPSVFFRKAVVERVGGYDVGYAQAQDHDLWVRLASSTRFANLPDVYLLYRQHPNKVSRLHAEAQSRNSGKVGQRMLTGILGYEVPFEICRGVKLGRFETVDDAIEGAHLVHSLYDAFMAKESLSVPEKRAIRRDAARRLLAIDWPWWRQKAKMREFLARAFWLDPLGVARIIAVKAVREAGRAIGRW